MNVAIGIPPQDRGKALLKWRTTLGWSLANVANRLSVTTRTISGIESGVQLMPDARWKLFVHEVSHELLQGAESGGLVVVLGPDQSVLDVVSKDNYAGYALSEDGSEGIIASYSINRRTGGSELHRQRFQVEGNSHVMQAIQFWEKVRQAELQGESAYLMHHWVTRRVLKGELKNPELTSLKKAISDASNDLKLATEDSADVREQLMRKLDRAIENLMKKISEISPS